MDNNGPGATPQAKIPTTPEQWARDYRFYNLQIVAACMPGEVIGSFKRPIEVWAPLQERLRPIADVDALWGQGGKFNTRRNIGVVCGRCSDNLMCIDLDVQSHAAAAVWWERLLLEHNDGEPLVTAEQKTGGGGRQLFFRCPLGFVIPTRKTPIGVDIRGQGGFAMLPPSLHESGDYYQWLPGQSPFEVNIAMAPQWLLDAVVALVKEHGELNVGGAAQSTLPRAQDPGLAALFGVAEAAPTPVTGVIPVNGQGNRTPFNTLFEDREDREFKQIWHWLLEHRRQSPAAPVPPPPDGAILERLIREGFDRYRREIVSRLDDKPTTHDINEYAYKVRNTVKNKWGTPLFEAEAIRPPPGAPPATGASPSLAIAPAAPMAPIETVSLFPIDGAKLPVRDWIAPGLLLRASVSMLVAPPGTGKSLFTLQLSIMLAIGGAWGGYRARRQERVLLINAEDDIIEMRRRLVAAAEVMGVDQGAIADRVRGAPSLASMVATRTDPKTKVVVRTPLLDELAEVIRRDGITVLVVDPFAETFEGDENSNSEVKWAAIYWRELAKATGIGLFLVHHTRKHTQGQHGIADNARGAGALIGVVRIVLTLFGMDPTDAKALEVDEEERRDLVRLDDAKANYTRLLGARWFKKRTVTLPNATAFIPGDDVGVLEPWEPPLNLPDTTALCRVLEELTAGIRLGGSTTVGVEPTGVRYCLSPRSQARWAGKMFMELTECNREIAKRYLDEWVANKLIWEEDYPDPKTRKLTPSVFVAPRQKWPGHSEVYE